MQASERAVFSLGTVFFFVATVFQQPVAELSHALGRKLALLLVLAVFAAGSLVAATAATMASLLVGRGMQGFALGGSVLSGIVLTDLVGVRDRAAWMPLQNGVWVVGLATGPLIGAALLKVFGGSLLLLRFIFLGGGGGGGKPFFKKNYFPKKKEKKRNSLFCLSFPLFTSLFHLFLLPVLDILLLSRGLRNQHKPVPWPRFLPAFPPFFFLWPPPPPLFSLCRGE